MARFHYLTTGTALHTVEAADEVEAARAVFTDRVNVVQATTSPSGAVLSYQAFVVDEFGTDYRGTLLPARDKGPRAR